MKRNALFILLQTALVGAYAKAAVVDPSDERGGEQSTTKIASDQQHAMPRVRILHLDGREIELDQLELTRDGFVRGRTDGGAEMWPQCDVLRITSLARSLGAERLADSHGRPTWEIRFNDGGMCRGVLLPRATGAPGRSVRFEIGLPEPVDLAISALSGLHRISATGDEARREFESRMSSREAGVDLLLIASEGRSVTLQGSLENLDDNGWEFNVGGKPRRGDFRQVQSFVLGAPAARIGSAAAWLDLSTGGRIACRITSADEKGVALTSDALGPLLVPWRLVRQIDLQSDRIVPLGRLVPTEDVQRSMPGALWPFRVDMNITGGAIRMSGMTYSRGIGVHAYQLLRYDLSGHYERFSAVVGVDDSVGGHGSVVFRVLADDRLLFESRTLRGGDAPQAVAIDISGASVLTLECDTADELDLSDHANWANAVLIRSVEKVKTKVEGESP